jgi:hypothetical protein
MALQYVTQFLSLSEPGSVSARLTHSASSSRLYVGTSHMLHVPCSEIPVASSASDVSNRNLLRFISYRSHIVWSSPLNRFYLLVPIATCWEEGHGYQMRCPPPPHLLCFWLVKCKVSSGDFGFINPLLIRMSTFYSQCFLIFDLWPLSRFWIVLLISVEERLQTDRCADTDCRGSSEM